MAKKCGNLFKINLLIDLLSLKGSKQRITVIIMGLIFLGFIPIEYLSKTKFCLYELIFGDTKHYSHGITRAMSLFLKGRFNEAYSFNIFVFFVMFIIFTILITDCIKLYKNKN